MMISLTIIKNINHLQKRSKISQQKEFQNISYDLNLENIIYLPFFFIISLNLFGTIIKFFYTQIVK